MTEVEKDLLIGKMTDNPDSLTDQDLDAISKDSELREIYEISCLIKRVASSKIEVDGVKEWELFRPRIKKNPMLFIRYMRIAAIFLGVLVLSYIVIKTVNNVYEKPATPVMSQNNEIIKEKQKSGTQDLNFTFNSDSISTGKVDRNSNELAGKIIKTKNTTEEEIQIEIQTANEIDIDEYLRIEEAKIENELALLTSQMYLDEIERIKPKLESLGIDEVWIDNEIKKMTMK